jgi:hypothetical protein
MVGSSTRCGARNAFGCRRGTWCPRCTGFRCEVSLRINASSTLLTTTPVAAAGSGGIHRPHWRSMRNDCCSQKGWIKDPVPVEANLITDPELRKSPRVCYSAFGAGPVGQPLPDMHHRRPACSALPSRFLAVEAVVPWLNVRAKRLASDLYPSVGTEGRWRLLNNKRSLAA